MRNSKSKCNLIPILIAAGAIGLFNVLTLLPAEAQLFAYVTHNIAPSTGQTNVSVIDVDPNSPDFNMVVDWITVGNSPIEVAVTPDGTRAYVTNSGSDTVSVIDTATNTVTTTIPVGGGPFGVAITPDGTRAYVTNADSDDVSVVDTDPTSATFNMELLPPIPVGDLPNGVAFTPDGTRAYVANTGPSGNSDGTVSVIDTSTNTVIGSPIPVGTNPRGVAITPDGTLAYVTTDSGEGIKVIDTTLNAVFTSVLALPGSGNGDTTRIAITPDGTRAYVTVRNEVCNIPPGSTNFSRCVRVIDTDPNSPTVNSPLAEIPVGNRPQGLAITPDGTRAYVAVRIDGVVGVIDTNPNSPPHTKVDIDANVNGRTEHLFGVAVIPALPALNVAMDIKPGSFPNSINLGSNGNVPVAILSTDTFDATTVDPMTVTLASASVKMKGKGTPMASFEDVDGDGLLDQVVHVDTQTLDLTYGDVEAVLEGVADGTLIRGMDSIRVVP